MISRFVSFLEDGEWHTFEQIKEYLGVSEDELRKVTDFLKEFGFISVSEREHKVKLDPAFLELPL